jgi:hypothetical protein
LKDRSRDYSIGEIRRIKIEVDINRMLSTALKKRLADELRRVNGVTDAMVRPLLKDGSVSGTTRLLQQNQIDVKSAGNWLTIEALKARISEIGSDINALHKQRRDFEDTLSSSKRGPST